MNIKNITDSGKALSSSQLGKSNDKKAEGEKKTSDSQATSKSDYLELSDDAKKAMSIQTKIRTGFYDKPEVVDTVARKISIEL